MTIWLMRHTSGNPPKNRKNIILIVVSSYTSVAYVIFTHVVYLFQIRQKEKYKCGTCQYAEVVSQSSQT